jgi:hypothetical protein
MTKAFSDFYLPNQIIQSEHDDSSMSVQHLYDLLTDGGDLLDIIDPGKNLEDWVEFKISRARQDIADVKSYLKNNPHSEQQVQANKTPTEKLADIFDLPLDKIVEHGTDEEALKNIVLNPEVKKELRKKSLDQIYEDAHLYEIAQQSELKEFRDAATDKIKSENYLKKLAKNGLSGVRYLAVKKITDQAALLDIALHDKHEVIKEAATERIEAQNELKKLFSDSTDDAQKLHAIEKIADQIFLKKISTDQNEKDIFKLEALQKIKDEKTLFNIAKDESSGQLIKENCIHKIKNQALLKKLFEVHGLQWKIRELIIQKIEDKSFVKEIAEHTKEWDADVREWAVKKITDKRMLKRLADNDPDKNVRDAANKKLDMLT